MRDEIELKAERLKKMMSGNGLDAVMLNAQHNFAWATGGGSNGVDQSRDNGVSTLLFSRDGKRYLLASRIEMQRMLDEEVSGLGFEPVEFAWQDEKADPSLSAKLASTLIGNGKVIGADIPVTSEIRPAESLITGCRYELTAGEIDRYRKLGADASAAFDRVLVKVAEGQSEIEAATMLRNELAEAGIASVVTLAAADDRIGLYRHPVPTAKIFERTLLLVTCAKRGGLIISISRIASAGKPSSELVKRTEDTAEVNAAMWDSLTAGHAGSEIYARANEAYERLGYTDEISRHHQGGATGYRTREWVVSPTCGETVRSPQAFAFNPSVTGSKVEETVIFADGVIENITTSKAVGYIESTHNGKLYRSPGIFEITS